MGFLSLFAGVLIIAAVVSFVMSLLGVIVVGALRLLPIVFIVFAVVFFIRGGKIHIEFPNRRR